MKMSISLRQVLICDVCGLEHDSTEEAGARPVVVSNGPEAVTTTMGRAVAWAAGDTLATCPCCHQTPPNVRDRHYRARASRYLQRLAG